MIILHTCLLNNKIKYAIIYGTEKKRRKKEGKGRANESNMRIIGVCEDDVGDRVIWMYMTRFQIVRMKAKKKQKTLYTRYI